MNSDKEKLFKKIEYLDSSFKHVLNEDIDKSKYKLMLCEGNDQTFNKLSEIFLQHNKLSGLLVEDRKYLKNFQYLLENENEFDPFAHLKNTKKIDVKNDCVLTISSNNAKLDHPYLSLPAGYTCPFADICKTLTPRDRSRIDNKMVQDYGEIRCYAAGEEARSPNAQEARWKNKDLLDQFDEKGKVDLILRSLAYYEQTHGKITLFRVHESGDFYSLEYFDAWLAVANARPDILFYAYTKSLPFWIIRIKDIPDNFKLVASVGGKRDELITKHNLRNAVIVNSPEEAKNLRLPIDIDDTLAHNYDGNFALLIHGSQKAGTDKSKASYKNRTIIQNLKKGIY